MRKFSVANIKIDEKSWLWYLKYVILAIQEAAQENHALRLTHVKYSHDPVSTDGWPWWLSSVIPAMQGSTDRRIGVEATLGIKRDLT
jgi:hypothetical protein